MACSIHMIVCRAANGVIGAQGTMPWHFSEDLKHFKELTRECPVIMGRATWQSIGRPLPGRRCMVLTRDPHFEAPGAEVFASLEEAVAALGDVPKAFILGGAKVYRQAEPLADVLDVTQIDRDFAGDATFDEPDPGRWRVAQEETFPAGVSHPWGWSYRTYVRR